MKKELEFKKPLWLTSTNFVKHPPVPQPHNMPVHQDLHNYFTRIFNDHPGKTHFFVTVDSLINDLEATFKGKYDRADIEHRLQVDFELTPAGYLINRSDYIPATNH